MSFLRRLLFAAVLLVAAAVVGVISLFFILHFISDSNNYKITRAENTYLREIVSETESDIIPLGTLESEMYRINPDYICWLRIDGTRIDHPVVRGFDNAKYTGTSFYGEPNDLGALFIDYRNKEDRLSNIIIYGHNSMQGEMFGDLHLLLDEQTLNENRIITINIGGEIFEYEIFSVKLSDIYDIAYTIDFDTFSTFNKFTYDIDAPLYASKILTLSTCVSRGNDDDRLIIQAFSLSGECFLKTAEIS